MFLIIKPTRYTNFSNLFLEWNSTCFGQFLCPSSGVFHFTHSNGICQQTCMTYTIAVCTVKNSWWWTEELSETCRISFRKWIWEISASSWFIIRNLSRCTVTWTSNTCVSRYGEHVITAKVEILIHILLCWDTLNWDFIVESTNILLVLAFCKVCTYVQVLIV